MRNTRRFSRKCEKRDEETILGIINQSAVAYKDVIPEDRYHEPYMSMEELRKEMSEMTFFGYEEKGKILGVAGFQPVKDATLLRHVYVLPKHQRKGIGSKLLNHIKHIAITQQLMVGTWKTATWATRFYEKHGFRLLPNKNELLRKYWKIPERQIELSVVLGKSLAKKTTAHIKSNENEHTINSRNKR